MIWVVHQLGLGVLYLVSSKGSFPIVLPQAPFTNGSNENT
jgi:hypothetical protein